MTPDLAPEPAPAPPLQMPPEPAPREPADIGLHLLAVARATRHSRRSLEYLRFYIHLLRAEEAEEFARQDARLWSEGENRATRGLRAAFALVAGGYLLWSQNRVPFSIPSEWNRWIATSVVANFVLPLVIANLFFALGLRTEKFHKYLPDERLLAWRFGWKWRPLKRFALQSLAMSAVMLPILWFYSRDPNFRGFYGAYFPAVSGAAGWAWLVATLIVYMACWEWFFRGFLLFSLAQGFGPVAAIVIQAAMFGLAHGGKLGPEMASSFAGGLILGIVAWREKSFVPAFLTHAIVHVIWAALVLRG